MILVVDPFVRFKQKEGDRERYRGLSYLILFQDWIFAGV